MESDTSATELKDNSKKLQGVQDTMHAESLSTTDEPDSVVGIQKIADSAVGTVEHHRFRLSSEQDTAESDTAVCMTPRRQVNKTPQKKIL